MVQASKGTVMFKRLGILSIGLMASTAWAREWTSWRGPTQNGLASEKAVVTTWSPQGENVLWKVPVEGRSTPLVMSGRVYAITPVGDILKPIELQERVIALDAETGKTIWEHRFNVFDTDIVPQRVGWTSLAGDPESGNVYAHGTGGEFFCLSRDGKLLWKWSMTEEFGRVSGYGGRLMTPIIDEDRVIISFLSSSWGNQGPPLHRYVAFDKKNGKVLWWSAPGEKPYDTTYAIPVVGVVDGKRMLIAPNGDGNVYGMLARTGEKVWTFKMSVRGLNSSPVIDGNFVYVCNGEENIDTTEMGRVVCIDASKTGDITKTGEVWRAEGIKAGFSTPALANGRLYVVDNSANLYALDAKTGKQHWMYSLGRVGKGSPTVTADGVIYVGEQNGVFHILKDEGDKVTSLDKEEFPGPNDTIDEIYGSPAIVDGRVYFMTRYNTYCLGKKDAKVEKITIPAPEKELVVDGDHIGFDKASLRIVVVPGEITVKPGDEQKFEVSTFDSSGRRISSNLIASELQSIRWKVAGAKGEIRPDGTFVAAKDAQFSAGLVTASVGEQNGVARVRITPELPISENFDAMAVDSVPPGWVGVGAKTKIVERDGSKVLQKLAENPSAPFMRIRGYATPPIAGGYTVTADILGTPKGERFKPDMGLVNSRYFLMMQGGEQMLSVESWSPIPRFRKEVPLQWKTDVWYRVKCRVDVSDKEARIRGKVWPRESEEPATWTIDVTDPVPNREGSPGIYAYSPGTTAKTKGPEVFFDNFQVIANEKD
jgi:outer membrane protein assembly factor BamB